MPCSEGTPRFTAEEFARLPDDGNRRELSRGWLVSEPLPLRPHARMQIRLERILSGFLEGRGLGELFGETGYLLGRNPDTVRGPDLSFVSAARLAAAPDETRFFPGAPDLAIEIASPGDRPGALQAKVADYLAAGAGLVWVVDPQAKTVTTYRTLRPPRRLAENAQLDGEEVLPGFSIRVGELFDS